MFSSHFEEKLFAGRRKTRPVKVGNLTLGGDNPIYVQSMTCSDTRNVPATLAEINALVNEGCELVRVAVVDMEAIKALKAIKEQIRIPLIADIHFHYKLALEAIENGADKIRINPGNIGSYAKFTEVVNRAKSREIPLRIGINSGSLEKDILEKHGSPTVDALVESAVRYANFCSDLNFNELIFSIKSSNVATMILANLKLSEQLDYPLHLGVTEAGLKQQGIIKSTLGIGTLLQLGIGDTIRVSLTGDAVQEISIAYNILKASNARILGPDIVACPTCGRIGIELEKIVEEVQKQLNTCKLPIKIAILGCIVNGPGEAKEADIGIAGGDGKAMLFKKGKLVKTLKEEEMVDALVSEVNIIEAEWLKKFNGENASSLKNKDT
ncbi:flavodoxin-dependent (E)-4-hydroxy-3-methylbut-2-enyl-diphosphate synthase [Candidatus Riflebacteria bacterium]